MQQSETSNFTESNNQFRNYESESSQIFDQLEQFFKAIYLFTEA